MLTEEMKVWLLHLPLVPRGKREQSGRQDAGLLSKANKGSVIRDFYNMKYIFDLCLSLDTELQNPLEFPKR